MHLLLSAYSRKIALGAALLASTSAFAFETTTFSVNLNDSTRTGTMLLGNFNLGDFAPDPSAGANSFNTAFQFFTPTTSGTYVFGQLSSPVDSVILLYSPSFSPSAPATNFLQKNDDGNANLASIADAALRAYTTAQVAGRSCGGSSALCPLLFANLTAGVDYYVVVSTYAPGDSLGPSSGSLSFFVIGDAIVGVAGAPAGSYVTTAAPTTLTGLASYLDTVDNSGSLATVATFLNAADEATVVDSLKRIFPVNSGIAAEVAGSAGSQTAGVVLDKIGTVLGTLSAPSAAGLISDGQAYATGKWLWQDSPSSAKASARSLGFLADVPSLSTGGQEGTLASFAATPYQRFNNGDTAAWFQGVGSVAAGEKTSATLSYRSTSYGVVAGYELALSPERLAGLLGSVISSRVNLQGDAGSINATSYSLGVYGQQLLGSVKLTGVMSAAYNVYDSDRFISIAGVSGSPEARYTGWSTATTLTASRLYAHNNWKIEPFGAVNLSTSTTRGYTEKNGGVYNSSVTGDFSATTQLRTGATFHRDIAFDEHKLTFKAKPYIGYQWSLNDTSSTVRLGGAGAGAVLNGRNVESGLVGVSLESELKLTESKSVKVGFDLSRDRNEDRGIVYAGFGVRF